MDTRRIATLRLLAMRTREINSNTGLLGAEPRGRGLGYNSTDIVSRYLIKFGLISIRTRNIRSNDSVSNSGLRLEDS